MFLSKIYLNNDFQTTPEGDIDYQKPILFSSQITVDTYFFAQGAYLAMKKMTLELARRLKIKDMGGEWFSNIFEPDEESDESPKFPYSPELFDLLEQVT